MVAQFIDLVHRADKLLVVFLYKEADLSNMTHNNISGPEKIIAIYQLDKFNSDKICLGLLLQQELRWKLWMLAECPLSIKG